jgi:hypothetical protein
MRHELRKLFTFEKGIYTAEALSQKLGKDVLEIRYKELVEMGCHHFHRICDYKSPSKATFKYHTISGEKIGWQFGEKTYFDTEEERDAERVRCQKIREESKRRTELLNKLAELDTNTLEKIVNSL